MSDPWAEFRVSPAGAGGNDEWAEFRTQTARPPEADKPGHLMSAARMGMQGLTLGLADESYGLTQGVKALLSGESFMPAYERGREEYNARDRVAKEAHPITGAVAEAAGSVVPLVAGGMTAAGAKALGLTGETMLGRSAMSAGSGAAIGGFQGFNQGDGGFEERAAHARDPALAGGALGAASPAIGRGVGSLYSYVRNALGRGGTAPGVAGRAADILAEDFTAAGGVPAVRNRMLELGPEAMLLDASPALQGRAQGLAVLPETREAIMGPLIQRQGGANLRLRTDVDAAVGPAPTPSRVEAGLAASRGAAAEGYAPVMQGARATDTRGLADALETAAVNLRGPEQRAVREVRQMLDIPGSPGQLDPSPQALHSVREAIDGLLQNEANSKVIRQLTIARQQVDEALAQAAPGIKAVDGRMQELFRQSEGLTSGQRILDSGRTAMRPDELADDLTRAVTPQGEMVGPSGEAFRMRQGLRADIDREIGNTANDLVSLKRVVKGEGDWNRSKLAQVFGPEEADRIIASVDREAAFNDAYKKIVENSQSTMRSESAAAIKPRASGEGAGSLNDLGTGVSTAVGGGTGLVLNLAGRGVRLSANQMQRAGELSRNRELAVALTRGSGPELDLLIRTVENRIGWKAAGDTAKERASELAQILVQAEGYQSSKALPDRWRSSQ